MVTALSEIRKQNMKALLVIDIQNSYISRYETDMVQRINERIIEAQKHRYDIVYIKNTKKLRSETVTDEFADELFLASDNVFCKDRADAFSSEELVSYLNSQKITEVEIIGVDGIRQVMVRGRLIMSSIILQLRAQLTNQQVIL